MSRTKKTSVHVFMFLLTFSFSVFAESWLKVGGSEEVFVKSYGFYEVSGHSVLVVCVENAKPPNTFKKSEHTYPFSVGMTDTAMERESLIRMVVSGVEQGKKFRIAVLDGSKDITNFLVVN